MRRAASRNFFRQLPRGFDHDQWDIRVDHAFTANNNIFVRFSKSNQTNPQPGAFDGFIGGSNTLFRDIFQLVLNNTHVFSPTVVNEFRAGYTRHNGSRIVEEVDDGVKFAIDNKVGAVPVPGARASRVSLSIFRVRLRDRLSSMDGAVDASDLNYENRFHFADTVSINAGQHDIKIGADFRRNRFDNLRGNPFFGQFIFGSIFSSSSDAPGSGAPFADYLMGFPSLMQERRCSIGADRRCVFRRLFPGRLEDYVRGSR